MLNRLCASKKWLVYFCLGLTSLGWGWSWVGIRTAVHFYSPGQLALGRYGIASMVLLPVWAWQGARWPAKKHWGILAVMGITGFTMYNFLLNHGEQTISAGTTALIGAFLPILIALGARFFFKEKLTSVGWFGVLLAFTGVATTAMGAHGGSSLHFSKGALLVLSAMVNGAIYGLLMKRMLRHYTPIEITTWSIWLGVIALVPLGNGLGATLVAAPHLATLNMILLGVFPGAISYLLYAYAATKLPMAQVVSCMFLLPFLAIFFGWFLLGELPSLVAFAGGIVTLFGAYLVNIKGKIIPPHPQIQSASVVPVE